LTAVGPTASLDALVPAQTKEFDLNLWFRRAAAWTMKLGTAFEHRQRIAQNRLEGLS
jgi:hypothetical protein